MKAVAGLARISTGIAKKRMLQPAAHDQYMWLWCRLFGQVQSATILCPMSIRFWGVSGSYLLSDKGYLYKAENSFVHLYLDVGCCSRQCSFLEKDTIKLLFWVLIIMFELCSSSIWVRWLFQDDRLQWVVLTWTWVLTGCKAATRVAAFRQKWNKKNNTSCSSETKSSDGLLEFWVHTQCSAIIR